MMNRAVFLDRDDTLVANAELRLPHPGDLLDPSFVRLLPGAARACRDLHDAGFKLIVITNQGGVARGHGTITDVELCNVRLRELLLAESGVELDAMYFCPYHPKGTVPPFNMEHPWRKPAPGMILQAARDLSLDLQQSWLIGDGERDIQAALAAGIPADQALRIGPGTLPDIAAAARIVLQRVSR